MAGEVEPAALPPTGMKPQDGIHAQPCSTKHKFKTISPTFAGMAIRRPRLEFRPALAIVFSTRRQRATWFLAYDLCAFVAVKHLRTAFEFIAILGRGLNKAEGVGCCVGP